MTIQVCSVFYANNIKLIQFPLLWLIRFFFNLYCLLNFPTASPFIFSNATFDLASWFLAQKYFLPTERVLSELQGLIFFGWQQSVLATAVGQKMSLTCPLLLLGYEIL